MVSNLDAIESEFSTPLAGALTMAGRGVKVLPLKPLEKEPFDKKKGDDPFLCGGINIATTDRSTIEGWFAHNPQINYGVDCTGRRVADVDPRANPTGWVGDLLELGPIPPTLRVTTWRGDGGEHIYFKSDPEAGQGKLSKSIDIRGDKQYVVGPGCCIAHDDGVGQYTIKTDAPLAPLPATIAERLRRRRDKVADNTTPLCDLDTPAALAWGEAYARTAQAADEGNRNARLFQVACELKDGGISRDTTLDLLQEHWCARCSPPYDEGSAIEKTVDSAYSNGERQPGCNSPAVQFEPVADIPGLAEWQRKFKARETEAPAADPPTGNLLERISDIRLEDIIKEQDAALIAGLLLPGELAVLYGESGTAKSFIGLDMSVSIAKGPAWHGRRVTRAPTLYVALEGTKGFRKRMLTIGRELGDPAPWFARCTAPVSLIRDKGTDTTGKKGMATIVAASKQLERETGQKVGLIVIDTLARAMAGDSENTTEDIMHFIEHRAQKIAAATGAAVMTVAHTNRAGDLRGNLHLRNASDLVLRVERSPNGEERTLIGEKIKDEAEITLFDFTLETVHLGRNSHGEPITSCVIRSTPPKPREDRIKWTGPQKRLIEAYTAVRARLSKSDVPLADVREECEARYPTGERDPVKSKDMKRKACDRAIEKLPPGFEIKTINGIEMIGKQGRSDPEDEFKPIDDIPKNNFDE